MRRIETERLILRPLTVKDADDVFEWVGDPVVNRYMYYALYDNTEQVKEWIRGIGDDTCEFGFELASTGKVIGAGSVKYNQGCNAYELGYNLNRAFWGQGFAAEASKAMIQWAHETMGVREFCATHAIANVASGNVIRKCGFRFEKYVQYSKLDGSETFDAAFYRLHLD